MKIFVFQFVLIMSIISCSTGYDTRRIRGPDVQEQRTAFVTTRHSTDRILANATYKWAPGQSKFYLDQRLDQSNIDAFLIESIQNELNQMGYRYRPDIKKTDFFVAYVAALKTALSDDEIQQRYGVQPGLVENHMDQAKHEKGTVIVDIIEPLSARLIWRGAGQAFASLESISHKQRKKRVAKFIKEMLSGLSKQLK